ncbi:MAG: TIGR02206 family membrane protein [Flavobacteriaceae bacterium]
MTESIFFKENNTFAMFGFQHLAGILCFAFLGWVLIAWAKKLSEKQQHKLGIGIAFFLCVSLVIWTVTRIYIEGFNAKEHLPLHLCNIISILLPIFAITRKKWMYEVLLFWILAGTSQAIITPDLAHGFPHYDYVKYFIVHCGLVIFILYATFIYKMRPTVKSIFKSFLALQVYFITMLLVNKLLGSNYFFISEKPPHGSLLDYFGEWPYYILVAELILFPYFFLIYLPFHFTRKKVISQKADPNS